MPLATVLGMVAGGGIEPQMPVFQGKDTISAELFQYNLSLFSLTRFNPLTEDFTEGLLLDTSSDSGMGKTPDFLFIQICVSN